MNPLPANRGLKVVLKMQLSKSTTFLAICSYPYFPRIQRRTRRYGTLHMARTVLTFGYHRQVSGSSDDMVRTGAALQTLKARSSSVYSVAFSPDGKLLHTLLVSTNWIAEGCTNILWLR
jgi:hypothetical protein